MKKAYEIQVDGSHYKSKEIQPMQYSMANNLDACQHTAIKYISRHEDKAGKKDLLKALYVVMLLIEERYTWTIHDTEIVQAIENAMNSYSTAPPTHDVIQGDGR